MRRVLIPVMTLAVALASFPQLSYGQSPAASSCPCTLSGTVADAVSGQPVIHALVRLAGNSRAALSDSEGRFQFEDLSAGSVTVLANKPGYLGLNVGSRSRSMCSVDLPDAHSVALKLTPESIVAGEVTDEDGSPLEGFSVKALIRSSGEERLDQDQRHTTLTDDEGKFRIAGLPPGSYVLEVTDTQSPAFSGSRKSAPPMGYPTVFYPVADDLSSAVPLKLLPGKTMQANFTLRREPYIQLSGTVSGFGPQGHVFVTLLDSSGARENSEIIFDSSSGSFHTKWISPGRYTLIAQSSLAVSVDVSRMFSFASLHVDAMSNLSGLRLTLQHTLDVPVVIHGLPAPTAEELHSLPLFLALVSKELTIPGYFPASSASEDNQARFRGVAPGTYELRVQPNGAYYAESATWGSIDLLHSDLVLESSASIPPIEVVVRDDGAILDGTVVSGDNPIPAQVVLLSERSRKPQLVNIDSSGRFGIAGLAPGTYRVFAVDSTSGVDYTAPSFLQKISTKIREVTLSPKQSASVDLEVATVEE